MIEGHVLADYLHICLRFIAKYSISNKDNIWENLQSR